MFAKRLSRGQAEFSFKPAHSSKKVALAGTFSEWKPIAMQRKNDGTYQTKVALKPGTYEYRFVVDDQWVIDPDHPNQVANGLGATNSIARFE